VSVAEAWVSGEEWKFNMSTSRILFDLRDKLIFVAGHTGMVGSAIVRRLKREGCEILTATRRDLDLTRSEQVDRWIGQAKADAVFLAAGKVGGIHANSTYPADFAADNMAIALTRGEIDVTAGAWNGWRNRAQLLDGTVRPVIQAGMSRHKELSGVPLMQELIADRKKAEVAEFLSSGSAIGRALVAPRAAPTERIAALRAAFLAMTADEKFRSELRRSGLELEPVSGEELDRISARILEAPAEVVHLATELAK
jgi:NAD(P)-dependent dehydrogenase (short-subunit alcohol dehydrogenase family)